MSIEKTYVAIDLEPEITRPSQSPLHVTLTPPAKMSDEKAAQLVGGLRQVLQSVEPFQIVAQGIDVFGPAGDPVTVRRITDSEDLQRLHVRAFEAARTVDPEIDPTYTYIGKGYNPHVSIRDDGTLLDEGVTIEVHNVTVLRKRGAEWVRFAQIALGDKE